MQLYEGAIEAKRGETVNDDLIFGIYWYGRASANASWAMAQLPDESGDSYARMYAMSAMRAARFAEEYFNQCDDDEVEKVFWWLE